MKKISIIGAVLSMTLVACQSGGSAENEPIKIGYIGPLTGDAAPYGVDTLNGTKLKIDEINAAGGIDGKQLQLIAEDGRCTGVDAATAAQKLINIDGVAAIVGGQCSGETLGAAPIAETAGVVMVSPISSSPDVSTAGDFIFRDYPSDALKTQAMATYFDEQGFESIAMITENTDFATAFRNALTESLGEDAIVFDEVVEPNTKDYRTLVTRMQDLEFDVFFPNGQTSATIGSMLQQIREQGFDQLAVSHDVAQDKSLLEIAPEATEGLQAINVPAVDATSEFGQKFIAEFGDAQAALAFAAHAYDAAGVLAEAMQQVGTDGAAIRDYLYGVTYNGTVGEFGFDENGDVTGIPYVLWEVQNGEYVAVDNIPVN